MNSPSKHLILLRHASAESGTADRLRALSRGGEAEAAGLGEVLAGLEVRGFRPQIVLSSPARRARETALRLARGLPQAPRIEEDETLYLASPGQILARLQALPDREQQVLIVGHNPGLAELVQWLVSGGTAEVLVRASRGLTPAAFAALRIATARWRDLEPGCAELVEFLRPSDWPAD
jgi:phosphohistidine phosphatase SixA